MSRVLWHKWHNFKKRQTGTDHHRRQQLSDGATGGLCRSVGFLGISVSFLTSGPGGGYGKPILLLFGGLPEGGAVVQPLG